MMSEILSEIDGGHPAGAEFALDGVAVGEGGFQTVKCVRHSAPTPAAALRWGVRAQAASLLKQQVAMGCAVYRHSCGRQNAAAL